MRCPVCQSALRIELKEQSPDDDEALARRDAWRALEDEALLREAKNGE